MTNWQCVWACVLMLGACTERNPAYCGDGTCVDPGKPFCDIDGSFAGTGGTCIAVSCMPGEFAKCRGDIAITCNETGTNYDLLRCEMGCDPDASGCNECTTNAQCTATNVCDTQTHRCRGCAADDECDSRVCDLQSGECVAESSIVYASPNGSGTCSRTQPCSLMKAFIQAANATPLGVVRMLPGNYASPLKTNIRTGEPVKIVATGANMVVIGDTAAIVVDAGSKVEFRNLTATSERLVQCGLASMFDPISEVHLRDSTLTTAGSSTGFEIQRCKLDFDNVSVSPTTTTVLGTRNDSVLTADRLYIRGPEGSGTSLVVAGERVAVDIVNSVLDNVRIVAFLNDTGPPGTSLRLAHTTALFADTSNLCIGPHPSYISFAFENSIIAVRGPDDVFASAAACKFVSTLLTRQTVPPSGTFVADPTFLDFTARNFHLRSDSPAIDSASTGTITTDHDLEGTARPQGATSDLGAYEFRP